MNVKFGVNAPSGEHFPSQSSRKTSSHAVAPKSTQGQGEATATLEISDQATEQAKRAEKIEKAKEEMKRLEEQAKRWQEELEIIKKQDEAAREEAKIRINCLKIAMRIISGDEVPRADHSYLAKHDPPMYANAIMLRLENEKPKKHKRLSEDEKQDMPQVGSVSETTSAQETAIPSDEGE